MEETLTPLRRFFLAFAAFFAVLFDRRFAEEVHRVRERQKALPPGGKKPGEKPPPTPTVSPGRGEGVTVAASPARQEVQKPAPPAPKAPDHAGPLHALALLQRDGRLLDFLEESLEGFSDSEIGAAARTVHEGCKKALDAYLTLEPIYREPEGASITVLAGFDAAAVRLTGNVVGAPPFKGSLRHHGWRAARVAFPPPPAHDPSILAPAEVEL
ncbi:MAG TPA: DUF2760 domain-containing protein [Anaeromyxobacteraceae bacterium]